VSHGRCRGRTQGQGGGGDNKKEAAGSEKKAAVCLVGNFLNFLREAIFERNCKKLFN